MKSLLLAASCMLAFCAAASAQYSYSSTSLYETSGTVYASAYAEIDYYSAEYYSLNMYSELDACNFCYGSNEIAWAWPNEPFGTTSVSWSTSTPVSGTFYTVWALPNLVIEYSYYDDGCGCEAYEDEYGYSLVEDDSASPDLYDYPPCEYEVTYVTSVSLGSAYTVADATTNPPYISAVQIWSGETGPGGSGYWILWGNDLFDVYGPTTASVDCSGVTVATAYDSPGQINLSFSIDGSVPPEPCNVWASTPYGAASIPVDVGFPFTPVQHNYPRQPYSTACRITSWFDATAGRIAAHHAIDVMQADGSGNQLEPPIGTPVYAMEAGTVLAVVSGAANSPYPACMSLNPRPAGDYVEITGSDGYNTIYFHITPIVSQGQAISQGQQVGTIDNSGCQSKHHVHVGRKDPSNNAVNFVIPGCVNSPTPTNWYDDPQGAVYDNDDDGTVN